MTEDQRLFIQAVTTVALESYEGPALFLRRLVTLKSYEWTEEMTQEAARTLAVLRQEVIRLCGFDPMALRVVAESACRPSNREVRSEVRAQARASRPRLIDRRVTAEHYGVLQLTWDLTDPANSHLTEGAQHLPGRSLAIAGPRRTLVTVPRTPEATEFMATWEFWPAPVLDRPHRRRGSRRHCQETDADDEDYERYQRDGGGWGARRRGKAAKEKFTTRVEDLPEDPF